ncbi:hypothetical protein BD414DRAFT_538812 [Trametes punicea]|nr:hypothetical protein BD414DRAFT_538812 [Trametes punicea]
MADEILYSVAIAVTDTRFPDPCGLDSKVILNAFSGLQDVATKHTGIDLAAFAERLPWTLCIDKILALRHLRGEMWQEHQLSVCMAGINALPHYQALAVDPKRQPGADFILSFLSWVATSDCDSFDADIPRYPHKIVYAALRHIIDFMTGALLSDERPLWSIDTIKLCESTAFLHESQSVTSSPSPGSGASGAYFRSRRTTRNGMARAVNDLEVEILACGVFLYSFELLSRNPAELNDDARRDLVECADATLHNLAALLSPVPARSERSPFIDVVQTEDGLKVTRALLSVLWFIDEAGGASSNIRALAAFPSFVSTLQKAIFPSQYVLLPTLADDLANLCLRHHIHWLVEILEKL